MRNKSNLGKLTSASDFVCQESDRDVNFNLSVANHSASQLTSNCALSRCDVISNDENSCFSSSAPCFAYLTPSNATLCAPGIICSLLEPCNNANFSCASSSSVCVVNSCCSPQHVCLPFFSMNYCVSPNSTVYVGSKYFGSDKPQPYMKRRTLKETEWWVFRRMTEIIVIP
jgi:hypothetical protein